MPDNEFDTYHETYIETVQDSIGFSGLDHSFFQVSKALQLKDLVKNHFGSLKKVRLIDVGCGVGALHPYITPLFGEIHGVDISAESIRMAKATHPENLYLHYNGRKLPFEDNSFDMALAVCVMHHVPKDDWENFLSELSRVVRSGGLICLIEHNPINPATRLSVARCPFDEDAVLIGARQMRRRLRDARLKDVKSNFFVFLPSNKTFFRKFERILHRVPLGAQYLAFGVKK